MGEPILIYGKSGSGKSRSLLNFGEDEILLANVVGKRLPFRKKFLLSATVSDYDKIKTSLKKMLDKGVKTAVIDDAGYLMTKQFMDEHSAPKKGSSQFDLYNEIADNFWKLINFIKNDLPDNVIVYLMLHEETSDYGETKLRTIGKLLDQKCCIEGLCTVVLRSVKDSNGYHFLTQTSGIDISKSPEKMFDSEKIDNDLKAVDDKIRDYWGIK